MDNFSISRGVEAGCERSERRKKLVVAALVLVLALVLFGAGVTRAAEKEAVHAGWPKSLILNHFGMGGATYVFQSKLASVTDKHLGIPVVVEQMRGTADFGPLLKEGRADILPMVAMVEGRNMVYGKFGSSAEEKGGTGPIPNVRLVTTYYSAWCSFWVRPGEGIESIADLKGKRIGMCQTGSKQSWFASELLCEAEGVTEKNSDMRQFASITTGVAAMKEKRLDALMYPVVAIWQDMDKAVGCKFLPISQKAFDHMLAKGYRGFNLATMPAGYQKYPHALPQMLERPSAFFALKEMPDDLVYRVLQIWYDNLEEIKSVAAKTLATWTLEGSLRAFNIPYHKGAVKFFKERGVWKPEHDALQAKMFEEMKAAGLPTE